VGFEAPRERSIHWIIEGSVERTVVSVAGNEGQGKPLLPRKILAARKSLDTLIAVYGSQCPKHIMLC